MKLLTSFRCFKNETYRRYIINYFSKEKINRLTSCESEFLEKLTDIFPVFMKTEQSDLVVLGITTPVNVLMVPDVPDKNTPKFGFPLTVESIYPIEVIEHNIKSTNNQTNNQTTNNNQTNIPVTNNNNQTNIPATNNNQSIDKLLSEEEFNKLAATTPELSSVEYEEYTKSITNGLTLAQIIEKQKKMADSYDKNRKTDVKSNIGKVDKNASKVISKFFEKKII